MTRYRFRQIRRDLGLTQADTAAALGVQRQTVDRWEHGVHPLPDWAKISVSSGVLRLFASIPAKERRLIR